MTTDTKTHKLLTTQLRDQIEYGKRGMFRKLLVEYEKKHVTLVCLKAGIHIPEHPATFDRLITVLQGQGFFTLEKREVQLEPGVFIFLPANTLHSLTVTEDLTLLKVIDRFDDQDND